jgi:DNA mismatch repair protein MutL
MAAVKHSLARYNIAPSLDFTLNAEIQQMPAVRMPFTEQQQEETRKGYLFNTFSDKGQAHAIERNDSLKHWKALYEIAQTPAAANIASAVPEEAEQAPMQATILSGSQTEGKGKGSMMLVHGNMLAATVKSGMMLIHIRRAQERICYERLLREWNNESAASQRILFPASYELAPQDALLLQEALPDLVRMGFDISPFGKNSFVVQGVPPGLQAGEEKNVLDEVVEQLKHESPDAVGRRTDMLLANMARRLSTNIQAVLQPEGQQALIDELFACSQPELTPDGRKTFVMLRKEELEQMLG